MDKKKDKRKEDKKKSEDKKKREHREDKKTKIKTKKQKKEIDHSGSLIRKQTGSEEVYRGTGGGTEV